MPSRRYIVAVAAAVLTLSLLFALGCKKKTPTNPTPTPVQQGVSNGDARCAPGTAVNIVDSTVIDVETDDRKVVRVRYYGIEAPSIASESGDNAAFSFNRFTVAGQRVEMEEAPDLFDEEGNLLCFVYANGDMVNREMLVSGYARVTSDEGSFKYLQQFLAAEEEARNQLRGLWQQASHDFVSIPYTPTPVSGQPFEGGTLPNFGGMDGIGGICDYSGTTDAVIKGNVDGRTGQRIFHVPGGFFYETIIVSAADGDAWFCTEAEARASGFRKDKEH
ncbi:MAG: hypothetical protein FJ319_03710 [SAR202 cluster bacterium]|nr:hypothetical protein [SAR202 cluster bacterium]